MSTRTIVRFQITGNFLPEQITERLGVSPDVCWRRGDTIGSSMLKRKTDGWQMDSGLGEEFALEDHLRALLAKTRGLESHLASLKVDAARLVSCVIYSDVRPVMFIDPHLIHSIASIQAALDFDIYIRE